MKKMFNLKKRGKGDTWTREFRSLHGWKHSTTRNSSLAVLSTRQPRRTKRTYAVWIVAPASVLTACQHTASIASFRLGATSITTLSDWKTSRGLSTAPMFRPTPSTVPKWCSSRKDLKTDNSKALETTALPATEAFKSLISIALLAARWTLC